MRLMVPPHSFLDRRFRSGLSSVVRVSL